MRPKLTVVAYVAQGHMARKQRSKFQTQVGLQNPIPAPLMTHAALKLNSAQDKCRALVQPVLGGL